MKQNKLELISYTNDLWVMMKDNMGVIKEYMENNEKTPLISNLIAHSIKLILGELMLKQEEYSKYPAVNYSDEDYVDMVIDTMTSMFPSIGDKEACEAYITENRKIIWGHIKTRCKRLSEIILGMSDQQQAENFVVNSEDMNIFDECLTVVRMECIFREIETYILEDTYGD